MKELKSKAAPAPQNHRALDASQRSAQAMWENKEIFQCISSAAQDAIIMMDDRGKVTFWNEAAEIIFGYSKNEIIGKQLHRIIMPARHLEAFDTEFTRFKKTGRGKAIGKTLELTALRKDGLEFPVELSLSAVKLQGAWCAVGIIRDISKRKLIEEELPKAHTDLEHRVQERTAELVMANEQLKREIEERKGVETALRVSKERFDLAVRGSKDGLWDWHITTSRVYSSPRLRELLGYQDSEFSESFDNWASSVHPGDYNRILDALHNHLEKGKIYDVEYLYRHRVGQYRWHHSRGQAIYDKEGMPIRMVGFISDITKRKQGEEALRKSEEKYRLLLNNLPSIVYRGFKDWAVEFVDDKIELLTGFNKEEFNSGKIKWSDLIIKEDLATTRYSFVRALKTDKSYVREYRIKTKAGEVLWLQDRGQILCDKNGQIEYVSGVFFDINERKRTEKALRKSEKELRILSSQLLSAEETERKRIARELHDGIGQALSAIKFSVENTIEELRKDAVTTKIESLESIIPLAQETIEEVRRIVRDLRPSILDDLGILATIGWFCREFESIYSTIRIEKEIAVKEHEIPAMLKTLIYRIMQEAFNNAAKHSQADLVRLYLKKTGDKIELAINDNGQGFAIEEAVYDKNSMRGFGLASMRERTELSGGSFTIKSAKGAGTNIQAIWTV